MGRARTASNASARFVRAVNVERDFDQEAAVEGYILTGTGRQILRRLAPAARDVAGARAWSLTGPYGTGKSAFAVFAANLFTNPNSPASKKARNVLKTYDPELSKSIAGQRGSRSGVLAPIIVSTDTPHASANSFLDKCFASRKDLHLGPSS